jgi:hypothetical protein
MSASKDPAPIPIDGGKPCPKCARPMQRFRHSVAWRPLPGRGLYTQWDRCIPCGHFQNYWQFYMAAAHAETGPAAANAGAMAGMRSKRQGV